MSSRLAIGAVAAIAALGVARRRRGSRAQRPIFTGVTCPMVEPQFVDWSTDAWFYPTLTEEIDWPDFVAAVELDPDVVHDGPYLPWRREWESWRGFLGRPEGQRDTESWYVTELPSGQRAWVWVASGVEHWFTVGGSMDPGAEHEMLVALQQLNEQAEEADVEVDEAWTRRALEKLRGRH